MASRNHTVTVTLFRYDDETETEDTLTVDCSVSRYIPGRFSGPPEDCYPAEGGEVEGYVARDDQGHVVELTEAEADQLQQLVDAEDVDSVDHPEADWR